MAEHRMEPLPILPLAPPFSLLGTLFGEPVMSEIFSQERAVRGWLQAEAALARAQGAAGVLSSREADDIAGVAHLDQLDLGALWQQARNVGYPILPLVRQLAARLPEETRGRLHYGATTQDIMDTGLALQLSEASSWLEQLVLVLGNTLADLVKIHARTVMAGRTHAQQAVPTTFGAKLAVFLAQIGRALTDVHAVQQRVAVVSLYGAGGTSAALGPSAGTVREEMGRLLGLRVEEVPWHVARDGPVAFGQICAGLCALSARLAREIVDLSRSEIAEVHEPGGHHRGASSTMPQKVNPISCEAVIGMAATAGALSSALYRAAEAGHERAAGEWQVEWHVLPQLATLAAGTLALMGEVTCGLRVSPEQMRENLNVDQGLVMAEAYMMRLAPVLGQAGAHDLVYAAANHARINRQQLAQALADLAPPEVRALLGTEPLRPEDYLGRTQDVCRAAINGWRASQKEAVHDH